MSHFTKRRARAGKDGNLTFPLSHVGNDNNLPFSSGRAMGKSDDNELILLKVGTC